MHVGAGRQTDCTTHSPTAKLWRLVDVTGEDEDGWGERTSVQLGMLPVTKPWQLADVPDAWTDLLALDCALRSGSAYATVVSHEVVTVRILPCPRYVSLLALTRCRI